jgi:hypothetical protein
MIAAIIAKAEAAHAAGPIALFLIRYSRKVKPGR